MGVSIGPRTYQAPLERQGSYPIQGCRARLGAVSSPVGVRLFRLRGRPWRHQSRGQGHTWFWAVGGWCEKTPTRPQERWYTDPWYCVTSRGVPVGQIPRHRGTPQWGPFLV